MLSESEVRSRLELIERRLIQCHSATNENATWMIVTLQAMRQALLHVLEECNCGLFERLANCVERDSASLTEAVERN